MRIICRFTQLLMRLYADLPRQAITAAGSTSETLCGMRAYCHRLMHVDDHLRAGPTEVLTSTQYDRIQTSVLNTAEGHGQVKRAFHCCACETGFAG
jgi:hypothetical protein